jgi:hypothetical protein
MVKGDSVAPYLRIGQVRTCYSKGVIVAWQVVAMSPAIGYLFISSVLPGF